MKICLFGNKTATKELMLYLNELPVKISHLVTLEASVSQNIHIAGKDSELTEVASSLNIDVYEAQSYSLKHTCDLKFFHANQFDIGLCTGWQRLIPAEVLDTFEHGVFGWHGSGLALPNGRGRSPLNWSIRLGMREVHHNCFKYSSGADSGEIFDTKRIEILEDDYIIDLQMKAVEHIKSSAKILVNKIKDGSLNLRKQAEYPFITFPALNDASGKLYPDRLNCEEALNIIRSCSRPFPGAHVSHNETTYRIWRAVRSCKMISDQQAICEVNNTLFIKFNDGWIETTDYTEVSNADF